MVTAPSTSSPYGIRSRSASARVTAAAAAISSARPSSLRTTVRSVDDTTKAWSSSVVRASATASVLQASRSSATDGDQIVAHATCRACSSRCGSPIRAAIASASSMRTRPSAIGTTVLSSFARASSTRQRRSPSPGGSDSRAGRRVPTTRSLTWPSGADCHSPPWVADSAARAASSRSPISSAASMAACTAPTSSGSRADQR